MSRSETELFFFWTILTHSIFLDISLGLSRPVSSVCLFIFSFSFFAPLFLPVGN